MALKTISVSAAVARGTLLAELADDGIRECKLNPELADRVTDIMNDLLEDLGDPRRVASILMAAASLAIEIPPASLPEPPQPN